MKKEKSKRIEFIDIVKDVRKIYTENNNSIPPNEVDNVNEIFSKVEFLEKRLLREGSITFIVLILFLGILGFIFYTNFKNEENLLNEISQKEKIITGLQENNRILNYFVKGENNKEIKYYDSITHNITITTINGKVQSYYDLLSRLDSIDSLYMVNKFEALEGKNKIKDLGFVLDFINERYGISYKETSTDSTKDIELIAPKLDSALILYPYFKNKLTYDREKSIWLIEK